jgi:hypothetical protein
MPLGDTTLHRPDRPVNLKPLPLSSLAEDRQQDDPTAPGQVVRDPLSIATKEEPKFPQLAGQLPGVRLTKMHPTISQQIDVERHLTELVVRQPRQPSVHLGLKFNRTPGHTGNGIEYQAWYVNDEDRGPESRRSATHDHEFNMGSA